MKKNERRFRIEHASFKLKFNLFFSVCFVLFFNSCQTLPPSWDSPDLTFKVKGNLISSKNRLPWTAYIYLKEETDLRADVVTPLGGTLFRLLARRQKITLQAPMKKSYCQLSSNKYKMGPEGPSFSVKDMIHLLRNKTPKEWSCSSESILKPRLCTLPGGNFTASLKNYKRKKTIEFKKEDKAQLSLTLIPLSGSPLEEKVFSFNTQGWTRLDSCEKGFF